MKTLYPAIEPYETFSLDTGSVHRVYVEECGNPEGFPVIFLHGGPASGCKPDHRRFFDPQKYHIILFDQRGASRSQPYGELEENTTQDLLEDMERIRRRLGIERWLLFGGSWGAALALLYAERFPERVAGMILRGTFLARQRDLDWFIKDGANRIYPEQWRRLWACVPASHRDNPVEGLWSVLWCEDELARMRAAREWSVWGSQVALGPGFDAEAHEEPVSQRLLLQVRMELHYARSRYFIEENEILDKCDRIREIPTAIIHGRNDLVCPVEAGDALRRSLPKADYRILPASGHVAQGEEMIDALVSAADGMLKRLAS